MRLHRHHPMTAVREERLSLAMVWTAAALGGVHAAFSAYWALGGDWLLRTVGAWAVALRDSSPIAASFDLDLMIGAAA